jgi:hypothetical protein
VFKKCKTINKNNFTKSLCGKVVLSHVLKSKIYHANISEDVIVAENIYHRKSFEYFQWRKNLFTKSQMKFSIVGLPQKNIKVKCWIINFILPWRMINQSAKMNIR